MPALLLLAVALVLLTPLPAAASAWAWPLTGAPSRASVSRPFAPGPTPYSSGHRGVDLLARPGAAVLSAGAGVVAYAGPLAGRGVVVVVHGALRTTYEPVRAGVRVGQPVLTGQRIGALEPGHRGCPAAACLHWGLRRGLDHLDPLRLVGTGRVRLLPWGHEDRSRAGPAGRVPAEAAAPSTGTGPAAARAAGAGSDTPAPAGAAGTGPAGTTRSGAAAPVLAPDAGSAPRRAHAPLPRLATAPPRADRGAVGSGPPVASGGAAGPGGRAAASDGTSAAGPLAAVLAGLAGGAWVRRRLRGGAPP